MLSFVVDVDYYYFFTVFFAVFFVRCFVDTSYFDAMGGSIVGRIVSGAAICCCALSFRECKYINY